MQKKNGDEIQIFDMNHINDPEWRECIPDIQLSITAKDLNLKENFNKEDFTLNKTSAYKSNQNSKK